MRGDSRTTSLAVVTACFTEALSLVEEYVASWQRSKSAEQLDLPAVERLKAKACHLLSEVEGASAGLQHMLLTYEEDLTVCAKIRVLSDKIQTHLAVVKGVLGVEARLYASTLSP
jgi:hypothetical protein